MNSLIRAAALPIFLLCSFHNSAFAWPLDSVLSRADSCIGIVWTPDTTNTNPSWYQTWGSLCTGADSIYRHCDFLPGNTYKSIPYSYGGEDPYFTFRTKLAAGRHPGSHLCHYKSFGDPTPAIAGTDCTGFLCWIWNEPRQNTGGMAASTKYSHPARSALLPGDALIKAGSHAVMVIDPSEPAVTLIVESTSDGNACRTRTIDVNAAYWLNYVPVRNPAITDGISARIERQMHPAMLGVSVHNYSLIIPAHAGFLAVDLIDTRGACLRHLALSDASAVLDLSTLPAGLYIARLSTNTTSVSLRLPLCR